MIDPLLLQRAALERVTRAVAAVGFTGLVGIGTLIMYDALARRFFLPRVPGLGDLGEVFYALVITSCFPIGLLHGQNVEVKFLGAALGPRVRRWLDLFAATATFLLFAGFAYEFFLYTIDLQKSGRVTSTILMPVAPWWWLTAIVLLVTVPVQAWIVRVRFIEARTGSGVLESLPPSGIDALIDEQMAERPRDAPAVERH